MSARDLPEILREIGFAHASAAARTLGTGFDHIAPRLESPIECALTAAFLHLLAQWPSTNYVNWLGPAAPIERYIRAFDPDDDHGQWEFDVQVPAGRFRIDILLTFNGRQQRFAAAVECDGHEFHERTKEQAQRDKERDRYLQSLGLMVLRFTGSEIWRDPIGCAQSAMQMIEKLDADSFARKVCA